MGLLENWREEAYQTERDKNAHNKFWKEYFDVEKSIYEKILDNPSLIVEGQIGELAKEYDVLIKHFVGFLDGINESLKEPNKLEEVDENTIVKLDIDHEKLYYNMLAAKAEWLYTLPQWDSILSDEIRKEITKEQRKSGTVINENKVGRNDPCPCGSGKKYKKCCGTN